MPKDFDDLVGIVRELAPQPRSLRWNSLSWCVLDAVWSINAHYDEVVVPLVRRVAATFGVTEPAVAPADVPAVDPVPLDQLLTRFPDVEHLMAVTNKQLTSTRGGIQKAEASLRYAQILTGSQPPVTTLKAATALLGEADDKQLADVDADLARVPGDGKDGVRRGYLWMLVGDDDRVKPDRMVLAWLVDQGHPVDVATARLLLARVAAELSTPAAPVTPWMVDHAIWQAARARRKA